MWSVGWRSEIDGRAELDIAVAEARIICAAFEELVKPFSPQRVHQAMDFAIQRSASERAARFVTLNAASSRFLPSSENQLEGSGRILSVDPHEIAFV
jgi:hypothetical protein